MPDRFPIAAITDEFSPDLEVAARAMAETGMTGAELRMLFGKNVMDLSVDEVDRAVAIAREHGLEILSIASPLLKTLATDQEPEIAKAATDVMAGK